MIKKLINYLNSLRFCKPRATLNVPYKIDDGEKIVRTIFSPINLSNDLKTLRTNAFRPPADSEDLSVNRIDYTTANFCKQISKENDKPESKRSYFGFALLYANQIKDSGSDIVYSPLVNNKFHSDIKIGYKVKKGEQLPAEFNYKIKKLTSSAKLFEDPDPNSDTWNGEIIV